MLDASRPTPPAKSDPTVHAIVSEWRRLTGGKAVRDADRRTLIACSGGADSSALVLSLARHPESVAVAHVVHDMRPAPESAACLLSARRLAEGLGLPFVSVDIAAKVEGGNYEAAARRLRYQALTRLAQQSGCRYIATAHHADEQLETILLRLLRGAGPRGFAGIHAKRRLLTGVTLIRPMLGMSREQARELCRACGWQWSEDASNADISRRRAAMRANVLPSLLAIEPGAAKKAAEASRLALLAADHLDRAARALVSGAAAGEPGTFDRERLRAADRIVLLTWLRGMDREAPLRVLESIALAIRSSSGEPREWKLRICTLRLERARVIIRSNS
ncbi:MAG: tRNA lysidine(34) synthetase TilS [Phycisphaeraceae bacterium]|nr:tRNA lysidine(34) synthetase TilS [Phycisphaeraceae bacterium]